MSKKIGIVLGTRPEVIKLYPIIKECEQEEENFFIIHTNQHYDKWMDQIFFEQLDLPIPKYNLNIGSGKHGEMSAKMLNSIESILIEENSDVIIVQGDTNTAMAGALAGAKLETKVAHVEAGLRSYDRAMPEEINRIVADHVSDYLFPPTKKQEEILLKENIPKEKIRVTGNTIVDSVYQCRSVALEKSNILNELGVEPDNFHLLTCHRPSNTDDFDKFNAILSAVNEISRRENTKCIFPMHPRLSDKLDLVKEYRNIEVIYPVNFLDSLQLQSNSKLVFTDSGGIQEEACILEKKSIILRTNTERPEAIEVGGSRLVKEITVSEIILKYEELLNTNVNWYNPFGDGSAAKQILNFIA